MISSIILLAKKSSEPICFGPLCSSLKNAPEDNATALGLFASTFGKVINLVFLVAGLVALFFLLWGALDWIMSEGDKEKLTKAQKKITNAVIGVIIVVVALVIFGTVTGDILGIIKHTDDGGWIFTLPSLNPNP